MIIVALESRVRTNTWRKHVKSFVSNGDSLDKSHASLLHQSSSVCLQFEASTSGQELRDMDQERFQIKSCPIWMLAACETDRLVGDNSSTILIRLSRQKATENSGLNAFSREMWVNIGQPKDFQQEYRHVSWVVSFRSFYCSLAVYVAWSQLLYPWRFNTLINWFIAYSPDHRSVYSRYIGIWYMDVYYW